MKTISNDSAGALAGKPSVPGSRYRSPGAKPLLLVSVRSEQEIDTAISGGADIIDLKEPSNGALAPTSVQMWNSVSRRSCSTRPIQFSAALGEPMDALPIAPSLPSEFAFAKVGPSGCKTASQLVQLWSDLRGLLNPETELVAVAYADHKASDCLPAETVFAVAAESGLRKCLVDTLVKDGQTSVDHLGFDGLGRLTAIAKANQLWWCWPVQCDNSRSGCLASR